MTEANRKSEIGNPKSQIIRLALIVLIAAIVLAIGHYGFLALRAQGYAARPGPFHFDPASGRGAADVPTPPRSKPGLAMPSPRASGRSLNLYASQAAPEEVLRFYRDAMPRLGWVEQKAPGGASAPEGQVVLWYSNAAGDSCIIAVSTQPAPETAVTVLRMTPGGEK